MEVIKKNSRINKLDKVIVIFLKISIMQNLPLELIKNGINITNHTLIDLKDSNLVNILLISNNLELVLPKINQGNL